MADKLTLQRWNELIEQVNELAAECDLDPLDTVEAPHKWSKRDIQEMQDKLKEICEDNQFEDIPAKWKQRVIDEFEEAIAAGSCCEECEEQTILFSPHILTVARSRFDDGGTEEGRSVYLVDWGRFLIAGASQPLVVEQLQCPQPPPEVCDSPQVTVERREGGLGYWGKQYSNFQLSLFLPNPNPEYPSLLQFVNYSGSLVNGYIPLPSAPVRPPQHCCQSTAEWEALGELAGITHPQWRSPFSATTPPSQPPEYQSIIGGDGDFTVTFANGGSFTSDGIQWTFGVPIPTADRGGLSVLLHSIWHTIETPSEFTFDFDHQFGSPIGQLILSCP